SGHEIPVAQAVVRQAGNALPNASELPPSLHSRGFDDAQPTWDPFTYERRASRTITRAGLKIGGEELVRVLVHQHTFDKIAHKIARMGDYQPELIYEGAEVQAIDPRDLEAVARLN